MRVTFTAGKLITTTRAGTSIKRYTVEEDLGERVVILEEGEADVSRRRAIIAFVDHNNIVITKGATRIPLTRVAKGTAPSPNEAPSQSAAQRSDVAGLPAPSGYADLDECVAEYYRCIEVMPPEARAAISGVISATKRIFEEARESPELRKSATRSCKQAVELAHASYCPPLN